MMNMTLLVNKQDSKIVVAAANKDFVDFLFYILTLPIGAITKLLTKEPLSGSLGDLYQSIENLDDMYILQNKTKDAVLNPKSFTYVHDQDLLLIPKELPATERKFYRCSKSTRSQYVTNEPKLVCLNCWFPMSDELDYLLTEEAKVAANAATGEVGFVTGVVRYMVMDDLTVKPTSAISTITVLNKLNIKDVCVLTEKEVQFGMEEVLKLLKASLDCKNVLTRVFLADSEDHVEIE